MRQNKFMKKLFKAARRWLNGNISYPYANPKFESQQVPESASYSHLTCRYNTCRG